MSRFKPGMRPVDKIRVISDGNPQAQIICIQLDRIDKGIYDILDSINITGQDIVFLYDYVCRGDSDLFCVLANACRRKIAGVTRDKLIHAAHNRGAGINTTAILLEISRLDKNN